MHAGAVHPCLGFRHKSGMKAVALGNGFYGKLEGHYIVSCGKSLIVFKVNFMLGRRRLMM